MTQYTKILGAVRSFFAQAGFREVATPPVTAAPIPERYIDAVPCGDAYFVTSPEVHLKRLLANGAGNIFQIATCCRAGEQGRWHHPEFTMLEWYRVNAGYMDLVADACGLLAAAADAVKAPEPLVYGRHAVALRQACELLRVDDACARWAGWTLEDSPDAARFDQTMVESIEPHLGLHAPTVLYDYPACFCPMARRAPANPARAERLEIYIAGVELANGCTEQTDADEQARRLNEERDARRRAGKDPYPPPNEFIATVRRLPPCAGMALGLDRLVMLLTNADHIADVLPRAPRERS